MIFMPLQFHISFYLLSHYLYRMYRNFISCGMLPLSNILCNNFVTNAKTFLPSYFINSKLIFPGPGDFPFFIIFNILSTNFLGLKILK
jgi:hypothetical protein